MFRLPQLISELQEIGLEPGLKSALKIHKILDGNKALFETKIEEDTFSTVLRNFEALSNSSAREVSSPDFKRDYQRSYELMLFHLNRII